MPSSTWPFSGLKRPWLTFTSLGMEKFTSPPFELDWPPPTVGLGSERPADFVRLFRLWYMVQCTGTSLCLGCWTLAVAAAAVMPDWRALKIDTQYFIHFINQNQMQLSRGPGSWMEALGSNNAATPELRVLSRPAGCEDSPAPPRPGRRRGLVGVRAGVGWRTHWVLGAWMG